MRWAMEGRRASDAGEAREEREWRRGEGGSACDDKIIALVRVR